MLLLSYKEVDLSNIWNLKVTSKAGVELFLIKLVAVQLGISFPR